MAPSTRKRKVKEESESESAVNSEEIANKVENVGISEYEKARLENIKRNEMFLNGLGLAEIKPVVPASKSAKVKGSSSTSSKGLKVPQMPT